LKGLKQDFDAPSLRETPLSPLPKTSQRIDEQGLSRTRLPQGLGTFVHQYSGAISLRDRNSRALSHSVFSCAKDRRLDRWSAEPSMRWKQCARGLAMIELEVERLLPEAQRYLKRAGLMNVAFPAWAVAAALELDLVWAEETCMSSRTVVFSLNAQARMSCLTARASSFYVFAHGLYREVMYQRQPQQGGPEDIFDSSAARRTIPQDVRQASRARWPCTMKQAATCTRDSSLRMAAKHAQQRLAYAGRTVAGTRLPNCGEYERWNSRDPRTIFNATWRIDGRA